MSSKCHRGPEAQNMPLKSNNLLFIAFLLYNFPKSVGSRAGPLRPLSLEEIGYFQNVKQVKDTF